MDELTRVASCHIKLCHSPPSATRILPNWERIHTKEETQKKPKHFLNWPHCLPHPVLPRHVHKLLPQTRQHPNAAHIRSEWVNLGLKCWLKGYLQLQAFMFWTEKKHQKKKKETCLVLPLLSLSIHNRSKTDVLVKLFNLKSGSFPGNNNLDNEVTTKYSLSVLNQASGTDNLTVENCFVVHLVNIKNLYPV